MSELEEGKTLFLIVPKQLELGPVAGLTTALSFLLGQDKGLGGSLF